jgi:hypothetical protein
VIEDVFKLVTVVLIQCHPGIFFSFVDCNVCRGYKSVGEGATHQNPTKLDAEDQEEAVDMAGKVFMQLDTAVFKCSIVRWKVGFATGAMTVVITVGSSGRATAENTTSSRRGILAVGHVAAAASKTRKVDTSTTAGEGKRKVSEWLWEKSHREQPIVRLAMCERSPLGLPRTQNRMSGRPRVAEILLMNSSQTPNLNVCPNVWRGF